MPFTAQRDRGQKPEPSPLDVALQQFSFCVAMRDVGLPAEQWAHPLRLAARAVSLEATIIGVGKGGGASARPDITLGTGNT